MGGTEVYLRACLYMVSGKMYQVPARSRDFQISVSIDASNVPSNYTLTIMEHCLGTLEPRTLVFFLKGHLRVRTYPNNRVLDFAA